MMATKEMLISQCMGLVFERSIAENKASRLRLITLDRSGPYAFEARYITNSLYCYYKLGLSS